MRPQIIASIEEARQHGDLKENAEYHAAREQHGFNEGRIQEIESKLGSAQVIDPTQVAANGKVIFGATVELSDADSGAEQTRSEERRVGKECVSTGRYRWSRYH